MTANNDTIVDTTVLTHDDLLDAYEKLSKNYREVRSENDSLQQKLYQEGFQRKTYENSLNDLQSELDSINEVHAANVQQTEKRCEELKEKNQKVTAENQELENRIDDLSARLEDLNSECSELRVLLSEKSIKPRISDTYSKSLEIENENIRAVNVDLQIKLDDIETKFKESLAKIEDFNEKFACMQDNIDTKKLDLEEKNESIEHLQDKLHEISTELALLKNTSCSDDDKSKSLWENYSF